MNELALFDPLICGRICVTLLNSFWQVALLSLMVRAIDCGWRRASVERSYTLHVAALVLSLVAVPVTFILVSSTMPGSVEMEVRDTSAVSGSTLEGERKALLSMPLVDDFEQHDHSLKLPTAGSIISASDTVVKHPWSSIWLRSTPWFVSIYGIGVVLMFLRLMAGILQAQRLIGLAEPIVAKPLVEVVRKLSHEWSLRVVPILVKQNMYIVPKVVGLWKPTILLPTAAITGLSTGELEIILAHEIAHVRRYDLWVNLLQRLVEVMLFFNPALWYLSRQISLLREYCCDEMACQVISKVDARPQVRYAAALLKMVELVAPNRAAVEDLTALAASGRMPSELRRRMARLFGEPLPEPVRLSRGVLAFTVMVTLFTCGPVLWHSSAQTTNRASNDKHIGIVSDVDKTSQHNLFKLRTEDFDNASFIKINELDSGMAIGSHEDSSVNAPRWEGRKMVTKTYSVADLVTPLDRFDPVHYVFGDTFLESRKKKFEEIVDPETLIDLIQSTIACDTWERFGGYGVARDRDGITLVIDQSLDVHEQINTLFQQLRRLQDHLVHLRLRTLETDSECDAIELVFPILRSGDGRQLVLMSPEESHVWRDSALEQGAVTSRVSLISLYNGQRFLYPVDGNNTQMYLIKLQPVVHPKDESVQLSCSLLNAKGQRVFSRAIVCRSGQTVVIDVTVTTPAQNGDAPPIEQKNTTPTRTFLICDVATS